MVHLQHAEYSHICQASRLRVVKSGLFAFQIPLRLTQMGRSLQRPERQNQGGSWLTSFELDWAHREFRLGVSDASSNGM